MNNYYYVRKEQQQELNIDTQYDVVICLNDSPFRNWIVGFDVINSSKDEGFNLTINYSVLRTPNEISDETILNTNEQLGCVIREIVVFCIEQSIETS